MKKIYPFLCTALTVAALVSPVLAFEDAPLVTPPEAKSKTKSLFSRILSKDEVYSLSNKIESKKYATVPIEVITLQDIENQNSPAVSELLNSMTSVSVQRSGSMGDISSFRIRGTDRVKVTLDGIDVGNSTSEDGRFYLQNWSSDDIERIEVVRGPQGNIQGAQASGGLVGMFTKQGRGTGTFRTGSNFGNYGLFKEHASYGMGDDKKDFYLSTTFLRTNGGGAIDDIQGSRENLTHDSYKNLGLVGNTGFRIMEGKGELRQIFRFNKGKKDLGYNDWGSYQDYNDYATNLDISSTSIFNWAPNDWYDSSTRFGIVHNRYNNYAMEDLDNPADYYNSHAYGIGSRLNFITQHNFSYKDWNRLSVGYNLEYTDYKGYSVEDDWMGGPPLQDRWRGEGVQNDVFVSDSINIKDKLFLKGGVRAINHSTFGTYFTPNGSVALVLPTFKIADSYSKFRGSWGQSVSMPSFYQMYGRLSSVGLKSSPGLRPEQLDGWDVGFEQSFFNDKLSFEFGYFNNKYKDYIGYTDSYDPITWAMEARYINVNEAKISGYEAGVKWQPNHIFKMTANYTFSDSEDKSTGFELPATPRNRVNVGMFITPGDRFTFFAKASASSDRVYSYGYSKDAERRADGFVDVSLGTRIKLFDYKKMHVYLTGTVYNLLNQNISMYRGYYQPGVHFMAGLFVEFRGLGEKL